MNQIRTHLKRIVLKTGTWRQAELTRLLSGLGGCHLRCGRCRSAFDL